MRSHVLSHVWLSVTPRTVARQTPLSMRFSRQEYWKGLPFPPPGDLPGPGIKPKSLAGGFFTTKSPGNPYSDPRSPKKSTPAFLCPLFSPWLTLLQRMWPRCCAWNTLDLYTGCSLCLEYIPLGYLHNQLSNSSKFLLTHPFLNEATPPSCVKWWPIPAPISALSPLLKAFTGLSFFHNTYHLLIRYMHYLFIVCFEFVFCLLPLEYKSCVATDLFLLFHYGFKHLE